MVHWGKVFDDFDPDVFLVQESYEPIQHLPPLIHGKRHRPIATPDRQCDFGVLQSQV